MKIAQREDISRIDRETASKYGLPRIILMENAGEAVVSAIKERYPEWREHRYLVFAGKGNNGGDGAVIARKLFCLGCSVCLIPVGHPGNNFGEILSDAETNLTAAARFGVRFADISNAVEEIRNATVLIDAIYGVGFHGEWPKEISLIVDEINFSGKKVVSVDLPSGIYADGGMSSRAVRADLTVTFGLPKPGLIDFPGREYAGMRVVAPIGIPPALLESSGLTRNLVTSEDAKRLFPQRKRQTHKGNYGHLLVVGGFGSATEQMPGAVIMAGLAALRAGAGLLTLAVPESILPAVQGLLPEAMSIGLPTDDAELAADMLSNCIEERKIRSVLIGNGFGTGEWQASILARLLADSRLKKAVLDAGALSILASDPERLYPPQRVKREMVLTPHPGEMARLTGKTVEAVRKEREDLTRELSRKAGAVVVQKDAVTCIADGDLLFYNETGSAALAKGGSGDVLAGLIAGFAASGMPVRDAAILGCYVLGRAGELYESRFEDSSALAREIIALVPEALSEIRKS